MFLPIFYCERLFGVGIFGNHGYPEDPFNKDRYFRVVVDRFKTRYASEHNDLRVGKPKVSISGIKNQSAQHPKKVTFYQEGIHSSF